MTTQRHLSPLSAALVSLALSLSACSEDPKPTPSPTQDMHTPDDGPDANTTQDMGKDQGQADLGPDQGGQDMGPIDPAARVPLDLAPYLDAPQGATANAKVYQAQDTESLPKGIVALGKLGDWILENEHVKVVIETEQRAMSPCPYGGNIIDGAYLSGGEPTEDNIGELCLLLNVGQTLLPESYEVISDGVDGGAAILAVTGRPATLDFLNFKGMARDIANINLNLPIDPDRAMPVTITVYYILEPGARSVRVVNAFRNHSDQAEHFAVSHLLSGGSDGYYFNPNNGLGGFGYVSLSANNLDGYPLPFLAFNGSKSSYAYAPTPDPTLQKEGELPSAGVYLSVSGAAATLLGRDSLMKTLLSPKNRVPTLPGLQHLAPGQVGAVDYRFYVGDHSLSTMLDDIYPSALGLEVGQLNGRVTEADEQPAQGATVTALDASDRAINQTITAADGSYKMALPAGQPYTLVARADGRVSSQPQQVTLTKAQPSSADLKLKAPATLKINVLDPQGNAVAARVAVRCDGPCPDAPGSNERDITTDDLPSGFIKIEPTDLDGELTLELAPGAYRVVVSKGMEWSTWPQDAYINDGFPVILSSSAPTTLDAEIAHVVDTAGVLSGDFHIHAVPSTDSASKLNDRVFSYIMEGVDVMVSTDHDVISDYAPTIAELGAQDEITSIVGLEITTSDTGHFNAFPVQADPQDRRFGALDWGNGEDDSLLPQGIYDWANTMPGEQVIQVNHPAGSGTIGSLKVDTLRGISLADPDGKRLPILTPDPVTGDTRLWSEDFTAMELMNGHSTGTFWTIMRWWLTMVGRGFTPTATAVTDTHQTHANLGGTPRSFVFVGEGKDSIQTFDEANFISAINRGQLVGTNGPFFRAKLVTQNNDEATFGQTLSTQGQAVQAQVTVETPEWMVVDTIDVYMNAADTVVAPGEAVSTELAPTMSVPINFEAQDLETVASGQIEHKRWKKTVSFELNSPVDAYVVFVVRGKAQGSTLWPVLPSHTVKPLAFSNPIYLDADGQGYDKPHLAGAAMTPPPYDPEIVRYGMTRQASLRWPHVHSNSDQSWAQPEVPSVVTEFGMRPLTAQDIAYIIEVGTCKH